MSKNDKQRKREKRIKRKLNLRRNESAQERAQRAKRRGWQVGVVARSLVAAIAAAPQAPTGFAGRPLGRRILPDGAEEIVTPRGRVVIRKASRAQYVAHGGVVARVV